VILCKSDIPLSHLKPQGVIEVAEGINNANTHDFEKKNVLTYDSYGVFFN
jgi:hypothetical protein